MLSNMIAGRTMVPRHANRQSLGFPSMPPTATPANAVAAGTGGTTTPAPAPAPAPAPVENHPADVIGAPAPAPAPVPAPAPTAPAAGGGHFADKFARIAERNPARAGFLQAMMDWRGGGRMGARPHMRDFRTGHAPAPAAPAPAPAPVPGNTGIVPPPAAPAAPLPASAVNQILPAQIYQLLGMGG